MSTYTLIQNGESGLSVRTTLNQLLTSANSGFTEVFYRSNSSSLPTTGVTSGDVGLITTNGTSSGIVTSEFVYSGSQWKQIPISAIPEWALSNSYQTNDVIRTTGYGLYQANSNIPANTPFNVGSVGSTWKPLVEGSPYVSVSNTGTVGILNNSSTYAGGTRLAMNSGVSFQRGSMNPGSLGISPSLTGYYEINFTGKATATGSVCTVNAFIGVNGNQYMNTSFILNGGSDSNGFAMSVVTYVIVGELIDFRIAVSNATTANIGPYTAIVRYLGN